MTDELLQGVEERVISLVCELEKLRNEIFDLKQENSTLRAGQSLHQKKLLNLISLLNVLDTESDAAPVVPDLGIVA